MKITGVTKLMLDDSFLPKIARESRTGKTEQARAHPMPHMILESQVIFYLKCVVACSIPTRRRTVGQ